MKYAVLFCLFLTACGESSTPDVVATPKPENAETPKEEPKPPHPLVGNWIEATNTLQFKADGEALINDLSLHYEIRDENYVLFSKDGLGVDLCLFDIFSEGNLIEPIVIVLEMICAESGSLRYTKE